MCLKAKGKFKFVIVQDFITFAIRNGGLAQLARAFAWHARGHRFDSDILHKADYQYFTRLFETLKKPCFLGRVQRRYNIYL